MQTTLAVSSKHETHRSSPTIVLLPISGPGDNPEGGAIDDEDEDDEPVDWLEPEKAEELAEKSGWPVVERDTAPSAQIPAATKCLQKHIKKAQTLLDRYTPAPSKPLTNLQEQPLGPNTQLVPKP